MRNVLLAMRSDIRNLVTASFMFLVLGTLACGNSGQVANKLSTPASDPSTLPTPPPVDPGRPKLVAFGDSLTAGPGIEDWRRTFPGLLQADLDAKGYGLQVINRGRSGDTSAQGLARLQEALDLGHVEVFILQLGANDGFKKLPIAETRANLNEIIRRAKAVGARVLLCGWEPPDGDREPMRKMYADLARENDVSLMPLFLKDVANDPSRLQSDGVHPNEDGAKVVEQNVLTALQPLLNEYKKSTIKR